MNEQDIEMNEQDIEIVLLLHSFFQDAHKTSAWLMTENPNFGQTSPWHLMQIDRSHKVLKFIKIALNENKPDALTIHGKGDASVPNSDSDQS